MATARKAVSKGSEDRRKASRLIADFAELLRTLTTLSDHYRPELHYMRGPGPKWREKYEPASATVDAQAVPALLRMKA